MYNRDWDNFETADFEELKGKTLTSIEGLKEGSEQVTFYCSDNTKYKLTYYHDCCATCNIEDIAGDINDLINTEILLAELVESNENPENIPIPEYQDSFTWSFYKLSTIKGSITIRWYGSSNGYYSETATFEKQL